MIQLRVQQSCSGKSKGQEVTEVGVIKWDSVREWVENWFRTTKTIPIAMPVAPKRARRSSKEPQRIKGRDQEKREK